jgi:hypothetical protein
MSAASGCPQLPNGLRTSYAGDEGTRACTQDRSYRSLRPTFAVVSSLVRDRDTFPAVDPGLKPEALQLLQEMPKAYSKDFIAVAEEEGFELR